MSHSMIVRSRLGKILMARLRLIVSLTVGAIVLAVLPGPPVLRQATRYLLAWDVTAAIYLAFALVTFFRSSVETCRARAALYDESDWVIVALLVGSAAASFGAIFAELAAIKSGLAPAGIGLLVTGLTVVLSWTVTHVVFTLHYANLYYRPEKTGPPAGLDFPGERPPDYRDFLYYSFVIGCAAQTADVDTTSTRMRMATLVHGIIAFAFNTAILALVINVGASLIS